MPAVPILDSPATAQKLTHFIQTTFTKAKKSTAIIAVSGGVDSATSLMLTTQALSPENVLGLHLPSRHSSPVSQKHAELAMDAAHLPASNRVTLNISAIIQKTWRLLSLQNQPSSNQTLNRLRLANFAARIRMMLIFDQAKLHHGLVVGTENYSEHLLGYYTRFGDEASDLEPLGQLFKTQVLALAKHLQVPDPIIKKSPTADLWPGQTDAAELGFTYTAADPILYLYSQGKSAAEIIAAGLNPDLTRRVLAVVTANHFKTSVPYKSSIN